MRFLNLIFYPIISHLMHPRGRGFDSCRVLVFFLSLFLFLFGLCLCGCVVLSM